VEVEMNLELLTVALSGSSLAVSLAVLFVCWRVLGNTHRSRRAGDERLEILREQQERLRVMYQERNILREELERLHSLMDGGESPRELPAPSDGEQRVQQEIRPWWRRMFAV
jgi:hypothetical protein